MANKSEAVNPVGFTASYTLIYYRLLGFPAES